MSHDHPIAKTAALLAATFVISLSSARAQYGGPFALTASDGAALDQFGSAVAVSGDTAVVGAANDEAGRGSAYVYRWIGSGWVQVAKLTASDGAADEQFGCSVAVSGGTIVVGASHNTVGTNVEQGSAYVFVVPDGGWVDMTETATLTASDGIAGDLFSGSVAISGDTIVVGAASSNVGTNLNQGSAYVFIRPAGGWVTGTQSAKLTASDGAASDAFGDTVAISGDTILVGAHYDDIGVNSNQGSAYVFVKPAAGWASATESAKLTASDGTAIAYFGHATSISGDTIVVGAYTEDVSGNTNQGCAYVFVKPGGGWATATESAKLTASDGAANDYFGRSVAIFGDTIVVGAYADDVGGVSNQGSAYVFDMPDGGWATGTESAKLIVSDGAANDYLGCSAAISGDTIVVGAYGDDVGANVNQGSARVFHRMGSTWVQGERTILAADGVANDAFGESAAMSGDTIVVGVSHVDVGGNSNQGAAYVHRWNGSEWIQLAKLLASDGAPDDDFGNSVAISGDVIVVAAYADDIDANSSQGSAYVFVKPAGDWADMTETAKLTASDGAASDYFGDSVGISGDTVVVGASCDDVGANGNQGSAYVFVKPSGGWANMTQTAKLTTSDGAASDYLGVSVAIFGDTVVVGADSDNVGANANQGSAYVFVRPGGGWTTGTESAKLTVSDGAAEDYFGDSAAIFGDTIVVGASLEDSYKGSAYVFVRPLGGWANMTHTAKLTASDGMAEDYFGATVGISGDTIIVGASDHDFGANDRQGSAYVFVKPGGGWGDMTQTAELTASDGAYADYFGYSVAISGDMAVVGVYWDDVGATSNQGSARSFCVAHECLSSVYNARLERGYSSIADAVAEAVTGDQLFATSGAFSIPGNIDYRERGVDLAASQAVVTPYSCIISLANGSSLSTADGYDMTIYGQLQLSGGASADVLADGLFMGYDALLHARANSALYVDVLAATVDGAMRLDSGATMSFTGSLTANGPVDALTDSTLWSDSNIGLNGPTTMVSTNVFGGAITVADELYCSNSTFSASSMNVSVGGRFIGYGNIYADVTNHDRIYTVDDTLIVGDLLNNSGAVITIQSGTTSLIGTLTNYGTIVGQISGGAMAAAQEGLQTEEGPAGAPEVGDGLLVQGDYVAGADSSLVMADSLWRVSVAGSYDVAVDDNTKYDMSQAELRLTGGAGAQALELMSKDIGASPQGLNRTLPGHYPIGTLRIASPATVQLVDNHDNDGLGQSACEALYVNSLVIDAGATLTTNNCRIYYGSLVNNGSVDDPSHLVPICTLTIPGDFDGDCDVDGADLAAFEACATGPGVSQPDPNCAATLFDSDNDVDQADFAVIQRCYSGENQPAEPDCAS